MQYSVARPQVKSGDLFLFQGTGMNAWVVRSWTKTPYSHVGLAWVVGARVLILESRPDYGGITINRGLSQALGDKPTWLQTGVVWDAAMEERALSQLGLPYGWKNDIRAGLGIRVIGGELQCAQYVFGVLGIPSQVKETPSALFEQFKGKPFYELEPDPVKIGA